MTWATMLAVARNELVLERRNRVVLTQLLPFSIGVIMLFAFTLDADRPTLATLSGGVFWATEFFAAVLLVIGSTATDRRDGLSDALRLSGAPPIGLYFGKVLALTVSLAALAIGQGVALGLLYQPPFHAIPGQLCAALGTLLALGAAGTTFGWTVAFSPHRNGLLALLYVPSMAPVLLGAARVWSISIDRSVGGVWSWVSLIWLTALMLVALGALTATGLLEEG